MKTQIVILNGIHVTKDSIILPLLNSAVEGSVISWLEPRIDLTNITVTIDNQAGILICTIDAFNLNPYCKH